jgi:SAM-dependent methyltransferase
MSDSIKNKINEYYTQKIIVNGASAQGVDWNSKESHILRFAQLTKLIEEPTGFTILDYGCGYGALIDSLNQFGYKEYMYYGLDISSEMIKTAKGYYYKKNECFATALSDFNEQKFDYVIANGLFNVKLNISEACWKEYILDTINEFNKLSVLGFAFNVLTSFSDKEYMKDYLHYSNPLELFEYCKVNFSKRVALLHDYPLYEYSIIVRK